MGKYIDAEKLKERFLKGDFDLTDKIIDEYIDDHFQELLNALVRRIAKIIKEEYTNK